MKHCQTFNYNIIQLGTEFPRLPSTLRRLSRLIVNSGHVNGATIKTICGLLNARQLIMTIMSERGQGESERGVSS